MKKYLLILSISLNIALFIAATFFYQSTTLASRKANFVDQQRVEDTKILERLLVGRLTKQEASAILMHLPKDEIYFDKPSENGIGAGTMFLIFGENKVLKEIEINSFEGP